MSDTNIKEQAVTTSPKHSRRYFAFGIVFFLCLLFFVLGWFAAEWTMKTRKISLPEELHQGMTRQQVESILRAPTLSERKEQASGDLVVEYILEHRGTFTSTSGFLIYVRFDPQDKLKSVFNCRTGEYAW